MNKHLGDKNLRMRHHYLGGNGTKPIARALEVMFYCQVINIWTASSMKNGTKPIARALEVMFYCQVININGQVASCKMEL